MPSRYAVEFRSEKVKGECGYRFKVGKPYTRKIAPFDTNDTNAVRAA